MYDEYLQDGINALTQLPDRKIGAYDTRSVLMDLLITAAEGHDVLVRLHRYQDTYVGTGINSSEDVRYDGFSTLFRYRRGELRFRLRQRELELQRRFYRHDGMLVGGTVDWAAAVRGLSLSVYAMAERSVFEYAAGTDAPDPDYRRFEGGITTHGGLPFGYFWRAGVYGGDQNTIGSYVSGELGIAKGSGGGFTPGLMAARRIRIPTAQELFIPETDLSWLGLGGSVSGSTDLGPEVTEEITAGAVILRSVSVDLFARAERSRIILVGADSLVYRSEGDGEVVGGKIRAWRHGAYAGFEYGVSFGMEAFSRRSDWTPGIPRYRLAGGVRISRRVFKETEVVTLRYDVQSCGRRSWGDAELGGYSVHDVTVSMTLLSAVIRFQVKNVLDERYATVPGFLMPERHYLIGISWELFD
jgi:hypothetical protein